MKQLFFLFIYFQCIYATNLFAEEKMVKHNLLEEIQLSDQSKTVKVLASPSFKLVGLGLKKGQSLERHTTPTPAVLIVQSGSVEFKMSEKMIVLMSGDYFLIPANTEHEVLGREDSFLYLIK